jgi:hypothetical protein
MTPTAVALVALVTGPGMSEGELNKIFGGIWDLLGAIVLQEFDLQ